MCCTRLAGNEGSKKSPKIRRLRTIAQLCRVISSQSRHVLTIVKNLLNRNVSPTCPHSMVNFGPLAAEICWRVWGTPANFNGFCVLAALLHGTLVLGVSETLRRWTEGTTYIRLYSAGRPSRCPHSSFAVFSVIVDPNFCRVLVRFTPALLCYCRRQGG